MSYYSSSRSSSRNLECKVYVGDLGNGAAKGELERAFSYYGPLRSVWVARNPPGFAFVEYEDSRDAEDACKGMDGKVLCGSRIRVELSTGLSRKSRYGRPGRRSFDPQDRCYQCGDRGHYAYDCYRFSKRGGSRRSRSHSRSRSRSRSRGRRYRSRSRSRSNRSNERRYRSPSYSRRHGRSASPARSKSRTPVRGRSRSRSRSASHPRGRSASRTRGRSASRPRGRSASHPRGRSASRSRSRSRTPSAKRDSRSRSRSPSPKKSPTPGTD
ncbi:serine and arginine rich splicing factor 7a isoform X2 [Clupea harengus]|uniref:Serine and arginine rich splicing factor 7a isoform X2 n=1 Tax=Clupea harengus TaxID=7950 RepID=A0A8M1K7Q8_CLUHA|nr:serine and arginine rich splicing factor 7a isoform X2 [Clupea harengus]